MKLLKVEMVEQVEQVVEEEVLPITTLVVVDGLDLMEHCKPDLVVEVVLVFQLVVVVLGELVTFPRLVLLKEMLAEQQDQQETQQQVVVEVVAVLVVLVEVAQVVIEQPSQVLAVMLVLFQ